MEISTRSLVQSRPLNSPEAALAKEMIEASRLPDGYEAQLQTDMTAFPKRWLERFKENDVSVAVLKDDQTLADTPILHALEEAQIAEIVGLGKPLIDQAVTELFGPLRGQPDEDYQKYQAAGELQEKLHDLSNQTNLGFTAEIGRESRLICATSGKKWGSTRSAIQKASSAGRPLSRRSTQAWARCKRVCSSRKMEFMSFLI